MVTLAVDMQLRKSYLQDILAVQRCEQDKVCEHFGGALTKA